MTISTTTTRRVTPTGVRVLPADADRDTWLAARRLGLGSSDIAAVLGVSPYQTAAHVWHAKRGELPDDEPSEAAYWGRQSEDMVARDFGRRNRAVVRRVGLVANAAEPWMLCTLDRLVSECPLDRERRGVCPLEVKTCGAFVAGRWRAGVPDWVTAQVVWSLAVCGFDHGHVALLADGQQYRQFVVRRDPELERDVVTACRRFWTYHVQGNRRPIVNDPEHAASLVELDNRVHPVRDGSVEVDMGEALDAMAEYEQGRLAERAGRLRKEAGKARLVRLLDGHAVATVAAELAYTYEPSTRRSVDLDRLAEHHPDVYADVVRETASPRLNLARNYRLKEDVTDGEQ